MRDRKALIVAVLAVFLASSQFQAVASAALPGAILAQEDENPGWVGEFISGVAESIYTAVKTFWMDIVCRMRTGIVDAVAGFWCLKSSGGEDGTGQDQAIFAEIPDCECPMCTTALSDYKEYIIEGVEWTAGANNVFSKFIPWQLWSTLYGAYILAACGLFVVRLISKLGMAMFGWVPGMGGS